MCHKTKLIISNDINEILSYTVLDKKITVEKT